MKQQSSFFPTFLKGLVALAAIINLIVLFLFPDALSERLRDVSLSGNSSEESQASIENVSVNSSNDIEASEATAQPLTYSIVMEQEAFTYDGTGDIDLLDGVSLLSSDGDILDTPIFVSIRTGDTLSQKILLYSADTDLGQITASRNLQLENYYGPSIQLPSSLPDLEETQLDTLLSYMPTDGSFRADDGYGNDITQAVTTTYNMDAENPSIAHCVFTVVNRFNDSASAAADINVIRRPVLTLTTSEVIVEQYSTFHPFSYVASAVDVDGSSVMNHIDIQGNVDTSVPGEYNLTYIIYAPSGNLSAPQTLKVIVQ